MVKSITPGTVLHVYSRMPLPLPQTHTQNRKMSHDNPDRRGAEKALIILGVKYTHKLHLL